MMMTLLMAMLRILGLSVAAIGALGFTIAMWEAALARADGASNDIRATELHHAYLGLLVLGMTAPLGAWRWIAGIWIGATLILDDALEHLMQLRQPGYQSPLHRAFARVLWPLAPIRWLAAVLNRLFGQRAGRTPPAVLGGLAGLGAIAAVLTAARPTPALTRPYHPATVAQLASGAFPYTHASVTGRVVYTRLEDDGDLHVRVVDTAAAADTTIAIIGECIPELPCRRPPVGAIVTWHGITRRDPEHRWMELHPIEWESP